MDFKKFDQRNYPTVSARAGYSEWAATYEDSVPDQLDIRVLESLERVDWGLARECLDLGCGTGRIAQWLKEKGSAAIDGIDVTPEMLDRARAKRLYRTLTLGSVEETGISNSSYDLIVMSLVDEHLPRLDHVYGEAYRLTVPGAKFVVVGMHPFFFMTGMPTHFKDAEGNPKAIETHIHLVSDHARAALNAGWSLAEMYEGVIDEEWVRVKPQWARFRNYPVNYGYLWERNHGNDR
jgi:ubiquinone/menaquinone biosynthesis C-methylase UbiE